MHSLVVEDAFIRVLNIFQRYYILEVKRQFLYPFDPEKILAELQ